MGTTYYMTFDDVAPDQLGRRSFQLEWISHGQAGTRVKGGGRLRGQCFFAVPNDYVKQAKRDGNRVVVGTMPDRLKEPMVQVGNDYYLPYPEKVARVSVVELGTGGVPPNPVLVAEDGGEHVVSADLLYTDELAACIRSAEMAKEIEDE